MANLHLHLYAPTSLHYSPQMFFDYLLGINADHPFGRFDEAGVTLDFYSNVAHAPADFKKSLLDDGSVVVYLGHGVPDPKCKCSRGLSWLGHGIADITPYALMDLLKDSRAKLVILATCASSTFGLEKLKAGPAVVVTNSGSDLVTYSAKWAIALQHFLLLLIGYGVGKDGQPYSLQQTMGVITTTTVLADALLASLTSGGLATGEVSQVVARVDRNNFHATIRQALDAANEAFKANKTTDRCELAHGEGSMVVFP